MSELPQRTQIYQHGIVDSTRWDSFTHRAGDIFVCTPPKCGTTWTQAICAMLVHGTPELPVSLGRISPWLDSTSFPLGDVLQSLDAQAHRRVVKTHTPLDGIPYFDDAHYVAVYRDPRDVFFSGRSHLLNQQRLHAGEVVNEDPVEDFRGYVADAVNGLESLVHHFRTFHKFQSLSNITVLHYANMKRDLPATVRQIAAALQIDADEKLLDTVADAANFAAMKQSSDLSVPAAGRGFWKDDRAFLSKGTNGQWQGVLSEDALKIYDARMRELLSKEEITWLQTGR
jgi:aryl sulfotransferase